MLTVVNGRVVYGAGPFNDLAPLLPTPTPDWSPVNTRVEHNHAAATAVRQVSTCCDLPHRATKAKGAGPVEPRSLWGAMGCGCWAY